MTKLYVPPSTWSKYYAHKIMALVVVSQIILVKYVGEQVSEYYFSEIIEIQKQIHNLFIYSFCFEG